MNIVLFGDSLINLTCKKFNFISKLTNDLSDYSLNFINKGTNSDTIQRMRDRVDDAVKHHSKIAILFWDSDVSDYSDPTDDIAKQAVHDKYQTNLEYVI